MASATLAVLLLVFWLDDSRSVLRAFRPVSSREPVVEGGERSKADAAPVTDAALMDRLRMEIARSVPSPMEPLAKLTVSGGAAPRDASLIR